MEELIEKIENLKSILNNNSEVKKIKTLSNKLKDSPELLKDIEMYRISRSEKLRKKIIENPTYIEYKHQEAKINFMILEINQRLKEITGKKKGCQ